MRLTHVFDFKRRYGQRCRWLLGTNNWVRAHVGDVIIVWRNIDNNTKPNVMWFPVRLTDTDLNIWGIQVKYHTYGNSKIPATEGRLWGTRWYYLFSAPVYMLRLGVFGNLSIKDFNGTTKNCVPRRGSSKTSYINVKYYAVLRTAQTLPHTHYTHFRLFRINHIIMHIVKKTHRIIIVCSA